MKKLFVAEIFGLKIPVKEAQLDDYKMGYVTEGGDEIYLAEGLEEAEFRETLMHEIAHVVWQRTGLRQTYNYDPNIEEIVNDNISIAINENLANILKHSKNRRPRKKLRKGQRRTK